MSSFGTNNRVGYDSSTFYNRKIYKETDIKPFPKRNLEEENQVPKYNLNRIYHQSSENMSQLPDNSVHLVVTSPPYNVGKDYDDDLSIEDYQKMLHDVWKEVYRVLVNGGRACINVANIGRKPYIPLSSMITSDMLSIGFLMRGEIIWNKSASAGTSCAWGSWCSPSNPVLRDTHEYIMVFCKGHFSRQKPINDKKHPTITKEQFLEYTKSIWGFPTISAKKLGHPAPYPIELPARFIQLYTYSDDVVLDPFIGSGTTALAATQSRRSYVGYEISKEYITLAGKRLKTSL